MMHAQRSELSEYAMVDDEAELRRRLPEIDGLRGRVRDEVVRTFVDEVPPSFWLARASGSHHPPDERGLGGTWLHTKRVFVAYTMLEPTFRAMSAISSFESNCARAAVLLHDAFKYGRDPAQVRIAVDEERADENTHEYAGDYLAHLPAGTDPSHDVTMAAYVRQETELPEEVAHAVECHGGSPEWNVSHSGPGPDDDLTLAVHLADLIASNREHRLPVYEPASEIDMMVGDVPTVSQDWIDGLDEF